MDLALSRLRIPAGNAGCAQTEGLCPDNEAFERLVSELAIVTAPPVTTPAHTHGLRGFALNVHHTTTTISANSLYWQRGSQGSAADVQQDLNSNPPPVLMWTRLELRKGLPLGFEVAADAGHGFGTSMWEVTGRLKLALVEGFHTGAGQLPDISLEATSQALVGISDMSLFTQGVHLTLSKPYAVFGRAQVAPLAAVQFLYVSAVSDPVDLAAGVAQNACKDNPSACDPGLNTVVRFSSVTQGRVRWVLGLDVAVELLHGIVTAAFEAPTAAMRDMGTAYGGRRVAGQFALTAGLGLQF